MTITRYQPWGLLNQLHRELGNIHESEDETGLIESAEWSPSVDIKEMDDQFVLQADIPGVKPEDIEVTMEKGVLTIRGEKETEAKTEKEGYKRVERSYGSFYRRFSLPETADADAISANSKHGVLEITISKRAAVKPKKIAVNNSENRH